MKFIANTGLQFALLAALVFAFGLIQASVIDINVHDTYWIVSTTYIATAFALFLFIISGIYLAFRKFNRPLGKVLGLLHFIFTLVSIVAYIYIPKFMVRPQFANMSEEMEDRGNVNILITLFVLIGLLGQLLFLGNIIVSLLRKRN